MTNRIRFIVYLIIILIVGYHIIAFGVFQVRNQKANQMTFYSHYIDVVTFKKVIEFQ